MRSQSHHPVGIDRPWRLRLCLAAAVILGVHVTGRVGAFCSPIRADSYAYSGFAWRIAQGDVLYRDLQVDKPPGLLWLLAPVYLVAPAARWALIPWESAWLLAGYWAFYRAARALYARGIALALTVAAALAINTFLLTDYTTEGFSLAESYLLLPTAAGVAMYLRAVHSGRWSRFVWTGLLLGICLVLKQTALPLLVAVALHSTLSDLVVDRSPGRWLNRAAALLLGFGVVAAAVSGVLAAQGVLPDAWHSMTTRASGLLRRETGWPGRWRDVMPIWAPLGWCTLGFVVWVHTRFTACRAIAAPPLSGKPSRPPAAPRPSDRDGVFLILWLATECLMLVLLPRRSFHYYAISCLPVILLSGMFWAALLHDRAAVPAPFARVVLAAAILGSAVLFRPAIDELVPVTIARVRSYDAAADRAAFENARHSSDIRVR